MINKPSTILTISKNEVYMFSLLLDKGLDVDTMVSLCFKNYAEIKNKLMQGNKLNDVLFSHQKDVFFQTIYILSGYMSLYKSIRCAENIEKYMNILKKNFISKMIYPLFIFLFSYFMILFFSNTIAPQLSMYHEQDQFLILSFFKVLYTCVCIVIILFIIFIVIYVNSSSVRKKCFSQLNRISIIRQYQSIKFSTIFNDLLTCGISTKSCFEILRKFSFYPDIQYIGETIYQELDSGISLQNVFRKNFFDVTFTEFCLIGIQKNDLQSCLKIYRTQAEARFTVSIKYVSNVLQLVSYISVGLLVLVVYQIMLVPLNMLTRM